jgi:DNA-binding CsgD family transcriptional regulator
MKDIVGPASSRETGIPLIGPTDWGTNICLFHETQSDLIEATIGFFKAGLENNECCLWSVSDPITIEVARAALVSRIPKLLELESEGAISLTATEQWAVRPDEFNLQRITGSWIENLRDATARGYDGLRISGNASWLETDHWREFSDYDHELDRTVAGKRIIVLCTHSLAFQRAIDISDIVRAHHFTVYCRQGVWEFADTPELKRAEDEIIALKQTIANHSRPTAMPADLTNRENAVLSQIVRGGSSKEIGRSLSISSRTIEFHRANIMSKTGARNVADLVRIISER